MKLRDLEAKFMRWEQRERDEESKRLNPHMADVPQDFFVPVETIGEAHLVQFICPKGHANNQPHRVYVAFEGSPVPPHLFKNSNGQTVRWQVSGSSFDDLTLKPSIQEEDDQCGWHGWVTDGNAE